MERGIRAVARRRRPALANDEHNQAACCSRDGVDAIARPKPVVATPVESLSRCPSVERRRNTVGCRADLANSVATVTTIRRFTGTAAADGAVPRAHAPEASGSLARMRASAGRTPLLLPPAGAFRCA